MSAIFFYLFFIFLGALGAWVFYFFVSSGKTAIITRSLNMGLFLITLPRERPREQEIKKQEKEMIAVMEQLYASLASIREPGFFKRLIYGNPHVVFEIASQGEEIRFYIAIPLELEDLVEKRIHGFFPKATMLDISADQTDG